MMKKESLKRLGILGVSFGLMASPLAFADMHEEDEQDTVPQEETMQDEDQGAMNSYGSDDEQGGGAATEYEEGGEAQEEWETQEDHAEESTER